MFHAFTYKIWIYIYFLCITWKEVYGDDSNECTSVDYIENFHENSSFVLIGFMQITSSVPSEYKILGLLLSEAMKFAVNEANENILPSNVRFSYQIYDNCGEENLHISSEIILRLILEDFQYRSSNTTYLLAGQSNSCRCDNRSKNIPMGIVGPTTSSSSKYIAEMISFSDIPIISFLATSTELNDRKLYPNFLRTIPTDNFLSQVIVDIVKKHKWSYVSIISSDNSYGRNGRYGLQQRFKNHSICVDIDEIIAIPLDRVQVKDIVQKIKETSMTNVIILFAVYEVVDVFLHIAENESLYGITWILPDVAEIGDWYQNVDINVIKGLIGIAHFPGEYKEFNEYFMSLKKVLDDVNDNVFLKRFFEIYTNVLQMSDIIESLRTKMFYAGYVRNAVFSYVYAFIDYLRENTDCLSNPFTKCIIPDYNGTLFVNKYLKNVKFSGLVNETISFDRFGKVEESMFQVLNIRVVNKTEVLIDKVGTWSSVNKLSMVKTPYWASGNQNPTTSQCSEDCQPGQYPIFNKEKRCCWLCVRCKHGSFKHSYGNVECTVCPDGVSNENRTDCVIMEMIGPHNFMLNKYILVPLCTIGAVLNLVSLVTWVNFKSTPIVKSSNFRLSALQLTVQMLLFITLAITFTRQLTGFLCVFRMLAVGVEIVVVISFLNVKSQQLLRVFQCKVKITRRHIFITNSVGYVMVLSTVFIELSMAAGIMFTRYVGVNTRYLNDLMKKEMKCVFPYIVPGQICFITVLSILCSIQAFRSRNLPSKYNEARLIFYSVFAMFIIITNMAWLYMNSHSSTEGDFFLASGISLSNLSILLIMYGEKTWNLWFNKRAYSLQAYQMSTFNSAMDNANRKICIIRE